MLKPKFIPRKFLRLAAFASLPFWGCGPKSGSESAAKIAPPPIAPVAIEVTRTEPSEGSKDSAKLPLIDLLTRENKVWFEALRDQPIPAYFLAHTIFERRSVTIEAEDGVLLSSDDDTQRVLEVNARVGSLELDNLFPIADDRLSALATGSRLGQVSLGDNGKHDEKAISHAIWLETDRAYREGLVRLNVIATQEQTKKKKERQPGFVLGPAQRFFAAQAELTYDKAAWIKRMRECSKRAARGVATRSTCRVDFELSTVYYVNSEGSQIQNSWPNARLMVQVGVKADDGMPLSRMEQRFAPTPAELPADTEIDKMIVVVNDDLKALHKAPVVSPYVGPAILEGRAAAVFFHEVFGHRIEGHRQKDESSGQTFASYVNKQIMPPWLSVYDDPNIRTLNGISLNGFYRFDDEGSPAERVSLVQEGILKGFLMGRNPIKGFPKSNGHGRGEPGADPVSRQGNLIVETQRSVSKEELLAQLLAEVKRQNKPYGMIFTDISGGFTNTSRFLPQAFKVNPVMTYRVYPDGRKEVVRGVDIVGSPLTALENIVSAARPIETFNGVCGAESGWVPVSASAPSLLIRSLEVENGESPSDRAPILAPPAISQKAPVSKKGN